jgi:hypothetical protein
MILARIRIDEVAQPLEPWEEFELSVSEILHDNDFDFFYQFEIPLSKPDFNMKEMTVPDYVAVYKGLYLVLDSKAWKEIVTPPSIHSASGKVGYTNKAVDKLFWDACIFETGLLDSWTPRCPRCNSGQVYGNALYVKPPQEIGEEDFYVYIDKNGDPFTYMNFGCHKCSEIAEVEGYSKPHFKSWEIFPTVVPIIVSKTPFKTATGIQNTYAYTAPAGGYYAVMGEAMNHCYLPKNIMMTKLSELDEVLKKLVDDKQYPERATRSPTKLQKRFKEKPVDPNRVLFCFTTKKRKESYWLSAGEEAPRKMKELSGKNKSYSD